MTRRKPIFIQGTSINLNDPENLQKWIEERKKRWPTAARVDEKKRKLEEAIARGQLHPDDPALRGQKRRRVEGEGGGGGERGHGAGVGADSGGFRGGTSDRGYGRERGRGRGRGSGFERGRGAGRGRGRGTQRSGSSNQVTSKKGADGTKGEDHSDEESSSSQSDSDDGPPEAVSSKAPTGLVADIVSSEDETEHDQPQALEETMSSLPPPQTEDTQREDAAITPIRKPAPPQPKKPPRTPFGSHPSLLRNVSPHSLH